MSNPATIVPYIRNDAIPAYEPFRAEIAELKQKSEAVTFDYESPQGNKDARSYIWKLRQSKAAVDKARKAEKESSLEYGRKVDAQAKEIVSEFEALIDVHQRPLDEIEAREHARVGAIMQKMEALRIPDIYGRDSNSLIEILANIRNIDIDPSYEEHMAAALILKQATVNELETVLDTVLAKEAEQAELLRLRQQEADRIQKAREEQLQKDAAERATKQAEEKAMREKQEVERKAAAEREASERREAQLKHEKELAEQKAAQAVKDERERVAKEDQKKAEQEAKIAADRNHQIKIHGEIIAAMEAEGIAAEQTKAIIIAIRNGSVPHMKIIY